MDPIPLWNCSKTGPSVPRREGQQPTQLQKPMAQQQKMYNHDGGFPLRKIIQQLQEEAQHRSVLEVLTVCRNSNLNKQPLLDTGNHILA